MKSMTGYAYRESASGNVTVSVEIKGYNSRFLDVSVYLPSWLSPLESGVRGYMSSRFGRGKVEVAIRVKERDAPVSVSINEVAALTYKKAIWDLAKILGLQEEPNLAVFMGLEGVVETETNRDAEKYRALIEPVLAAAADQFEAERVREGKATLEDILLHTGTLEESVKAVSAHVPEMEALIKENLRSRFEELLGDRLGDIIAENRILAETAVILMKHTISEELARLASHLAEFRLEAERNPSPGKKLDFLCQEINREVNTIGSKTPILEVSRSVVAMKEALENIREQLRNVE
ncbi:MAG: YicC family protein [Treponema sp.]|nr:YicC family protein [Treponema sp.]